MRYWAAVAPGQPLVVVDASDESQAVACRDAVDAFAGRLEARYERAVPVESPWIARRTFTQTAVALRGVKTPYVAVLGDDDFFLPPALMSLVAALNRTPNAAIATGRSLVVSTAPLAAGGGDETRISAFPQPSVRHESGFGRVLLHLSNFRGSYFAVHRLDVLARAFDGLGDYEAYSVFMEVALSLLCTVQGDMLRTDDLFLFRHQHENGFSATRRLKDDLDILDPRFPTEYEAFEAVVCDGILKLGFDRPVDWRNSFREAFRCFLARKVLSKYLDRSLDIDTAGERFEDLYQMLRDRKAPLFDQVRPILAAIRENARDGLLDEGSRPCGL